MFKKYTADLEFKTLQSCLVRLEQAGECGLDVSVLGNGTTADPWRLIAKGSKAKLILFFTYVSWGNLQNDIKHIMKLKH